MSAPDARPRAALSIAGSDSGGGAGVQADLKTFAAHEMHGLTAIAALTAQHTRGVTAVHVPPAEFLRAQLAALFDDFRIEAVKLGMLASAEVIHVVADVLTELRPAHVVLDPVMVASSGARLLAPAALDALRDRLIPLCSVLTPNLPEAELLIGAPVRGRPEEAHALSALRALGAPAVLLKGGHAQGADPVRDVLSAGPALHVFEHPRLARSGHGTGCTLASAIAAELGRGADLPTACARATDYVHGALVHAYAPGRGDVQVLHHFWRTSLRSALPG